MNSETLERIMEETRKIFFSETRKKINTAVMVFLQFCIYEKKEACSFLENFFHAVKGSSAVTGYKELSETAKQCENFMKEVRETEALTSEDKLKILTGFAELFDKFRLNEANFLGNSANHDFSDMEWDIMQSFQTSLQTSCLSVDNGSSLTSPANLEENNPETMSSLDEPNTRSLGIKRLDIDDKIGNILIIDDDVVILELLDKSLRANGFNTFITTNPDEAKSIFMTKSINLILLDVMLPNKSGFEIIDNIRQCNYSGGIIFLTSKNVSDDIVRGFKLGADDYITKPFVIEEMIVRIELVIKNKSIAKSKIVSDDISNAFSRSYFFEKYRMAIQNLAQKSQRFSLGLLDIEGFSEINKARGYFVGDMVLKKFVEEIYNYYKDSMVFRLEADKFIVLFNNTFSDDAHNKFEAFKSYMSLKSFSPIQRPITFTYVVYTVKTPKENFEEVMSTMTYSLEKEKRMTSTSPTVIENNFVTFKKTRILIIDDESVNIFLIKRHLEPSGYEIFYSSDGVSAIEKIRNLKPEIIILDLMLPKINGFDIIKIIREDPEFDNMKILVHSSKDSEQDIKKCYDLGIDEFMSKSLPFDELEKRIGRLLSSQKGTE